MSRTSTLIALSFTLACAADTPVADFAVSDSAGVRIVESSVPEWGAGSGWTIDTSPLLSIGTNGGPADHQFTRIVGAVRLDDGTVAVGDAGTNSVRFFDTNGQLVRTVGRAGNGPGEFRAMQSLTRSGDSIAVLDRRLVRITLFDRAGGLIRTVQTSLGGLVAVHRFASGRWLASEEEGFYGGRFREDVTPGLHRFNSVAVILDSAGVVVDTLGAFRGAEMAYYTLDGQAGSVHAAYGRTLRFGTSGDEAIVVTGDMLGFDVHGADGRLVRSVRAWGPDLTMRPEDLDRFNNIILENIENAPTRDSFRRALASVETPQTRAAVGRILVDPLQHVWLSEYENEYLAATTWFVFDPSGRYLGPVVIPRGTWLLDVGERHVVGVARDENTIESVRVHALNRR